MSLTTKQQILKQIEIAQAHARAALVTEEERLLARERYDAAERIKRSAQACQRTLWRITLRIWARGA
jgi:hypothetical protein